MADDQTKEGAADVAAPIEPVEKPKPVFDDASSREKLIQLEYPFTLDGERIEAIKVRRCSAGEISQYIEGLMNGEGSLVPPTIECSDVVWDGMDDDDQTTVEEAAEAFTPRRLLKLMEKIEQQASSDGGNTSVS